MRPLITALATLLLAAGAHAQTTSTGQIPKPIDPVAVTAPQVPAAPAVRSGPQRMPPPSAPEAPLTAPDFLLVLLRQQHPDLLENLEFEVWLAEQEALR